MPLDEQSADAPIMELRPTCLVICPGISFDEWAEKCWHSIDQTHKSVNFWVGDALIFGEENFGEASSQVLDRHYAEQHTACRRVALRIPAQYRREGLSWSVHREVAGLTDLAERIEVLDLAEANDWGARETGAEVQKRKPPRVSRAAYPSNGAPVEEEENSTVESGEADSEELLAAPNDDSYLPAEAAIAAETGPIRDSAHLAPNEPNVYELRACIERIRHLAGKIALGHPDPEIHSLPARIAAAMGKAPTSLNPLFDVLTAVDIIPDAWRPSIRMEGGEHIFGGRKWTVELRAGKSRVAIGSGPWLPAAILDAAVAAVLSDLANGEGR